MELRVLRYFLAVAREESISGAAQFLHLTQPTLSRQLMELEEELGKQLFVRGNRRVTLTEDGVLFRKRADEILALVDKTTMELSDNEENIAGDIYIGAGETDAMRLLAKEAKKLQTRYPQIRYHLHSGNADDVAERLDKGLLDFGLLIEPVDLKKYDYLRLSAHDTWGLVLRRDHPLAQKESITPEDLFAVPLLISHQSQVRENLKRWLGRDPEELHVVCTFNLLYNAAIMVDEGLGCALALDKLVDVQETGDLCFRPLDPPLTSGLCVVWKKYQVFSRAAARFLEQLQQQFESPSL